MATTNPTLTTSWAKLVDLGYEFFISLPFTSVTHIEIATVDSDEAPASGVSGHVLKGEAQESLSRQLIGPGYVYARSRNGSLPVVLNAWEPAT